MFKGLLLALWGVDICLAAAGKESRETTPNVPSEEDNWASLSQMSLAAPEKYDDAHRLAWYAIHWAKCGESCISECMMDFASSDALKPRLDEIMGQLVEWKTKLDEKPDICISELNSLCKTSYDVSVKNFKDALDQLNGFMKSADFFSNFDDSKGRVVGRSTSLPDLREAVAWNNDEDGSLKGKYVTLASEVRDSALSMLISFLEKMGDDSELKRQEDRSRKLLWDAAHSRTALCESIVDWEALVKEKDGILKSDRKALESVAERLSVHGEKTLLLMEDYEKVLKSLIEDRQETGRSMMLYFIKNDSERWESLVKAVRPALLLKPLANAGYIDFRFLGTFEHFIAYFMVHMKERCAEELRDDYSMLFNKDVLCSKFLGSGMRLLLLENTLRRGGLNIYKYKNWGETRN